MLAQWAGQQICACIGLTQRTRVKKARFIWTDFRSVAQRDFLHINNVDDRIDKIGGIGNCNYGLNEEGSNARGKFYSWYFSTLFAKHTIVSLVMNIVDMESTLYQAQESRIF